MNTTIESRIERYSNTYYHSSTIINALKSIQSIDLDKRIERLANCSNYLEYKHYTATNQVKLSKANFCDLYTLCPVCASLKQAQVACDYSQAIKQVLIQNEHLKPFFITTTIRTGNSLIERFNSFKNVLDKMLKSTGEFKKVEGYLTRIEYKQSQAKRWNVHAHSIVLTSSLNFERLREDYKALSTYTQSIDVKLMQSDLSSIKATLNYMFKPTFYLTNPSDFEDLPQILETVLTDIRPRTRLTRAGGVLRSLEKEVEQLKQEDLDHDYELRKYARRGREYVSLNSMNTH